MKKRTYLDHRGRIKTLPLWVMFLLDAILVSLPCILKKLFKLFSER